MKGEVAQKLLQETRESYDKFAGEFSHSRARFWDELAFLADEIHHGDHVLDIGCGNGRFSPLTRTRNARYVGVDYSEGLIAEARKKFPEQVFCLGDATALPFANEQFDIAYSFAVIHHIPSTILREQFIAEAARVLRPSGKLIITSWGLWSPQYIKKILMGALWSLLKKSTFDVGDMMLTFGNKKYPRYVHAFTKKELELLLIKKGFSILQSSNIARKSGAYNIVIVAEKNS